jgi:hypothetical protein
MVTTFGGDTSKGRTSNLHLQHDVNLKGLRDINSYCLRSHPVSTETFRARPPSTPSPNGHSAGSVPPGSSEAPPAEATDISAARKAQVSARLMTHPMVKPLQDTILSSSLTLKNVDLLIEVERLALMLGGCRVTFCKSGKDRTGMACTLEQSHPKGRQPDAPVRHPAAGGGEEHRPQGVLHQQDAGAVPAGHVPAAPRRVRGPHEEGQLVGQLLVVSPQRLSACVFFEDYKKTRSYAVFLQRTH